MSNNHLSLPTGPVFEKAIQGHFAWVEAPPRTDSAVGDDSRVQVNTRSSTPEQLHQPQQVAEFVQMHDNVGAPAAMVGGRRRRRAIRSSRQGRPKLFKQGKLSKPNATKQNRGYNQSPVNYRVWLQGLYYPPALVEFLELRLLVARKVL